MNELTLLGHFYNEEYLLPYWLNHHKKYFNHAILIDYGSTDNSVNIIKEICPTWEIVQTKLEYFYAPLVDVEVVEYEKNISGFRICLNTTEFLIGNFEVLKSAEPNSQHLIGSHIMIDKPGLEFTELSLGLDLIKERYWGIPQHKTRNARDWRSARSLHNYLIDYPSITGPGRHFMTPTAPCHGQSFSEDFSILWYGFSPFNEKLIQRKLQIQTKHRPDQAWSGGHAISRNELLAIFNNYQTQSEDLIGFIHKFYK